MAKLKQFKGAAGKMSSELQANNVMQVKPPSSSLFTLLKNQSDVDEVVFGHDIDMDDQMDKIEDAPQFEGTAGVHSSHEGHMQTAMWYGGIKGRKATDIEKYNGLNSSTDMTFQKPQVYGNGWKAAGAFSGGAGAPNSLEQDDGTYKHAQQKHNIAPPDEMMADFAAETNAKERNARPAPLPVLSKEHFHGSIKAVVFSGPDPEGNREVLGVPTLSEGASLLEKRDVDRRTAVAQGCRSQKYTTQSEFNAAAGLASDELYFANSADLVRRVKPVTRKAGYSSVTSVDEVVFHHDLEGGDKDGASLVKDAAFAGAAGASSDAIHSAQANSRHAPRDVPQMRDQMDNIVFGREMQESDSAIRAEMAFMEMAKGAGGQASAMIGKKGFDQRLEDYGVVDAPDMPLKITIDNEPRGDLMASQMHAQPREYPPGYKGAVGAPRDHLGRIESDSNYVVGSQADGGVSKGRARHDLDSGDIAGVITGTGERAKPLVGSDLAQGAAGKLSRKTNDEAVPLLLEDADTETEKKFAARNWSGKNVKATLDGKGYIEHDQKIREPRDKGKLADSRTKVDSVKELNLLKPDENPNDLNDPTLWMDAKSEYEMYLYNKNFGQVAPYGTDPLDSWYGKPNYTTTNERIQGNVEATLAHAYHKAATYVPPESTEPGQRKSAFKLAEIKAEYEGARKQVREGNGIAKEVPFGVDAIATDYTTSAQVGQAGALAAWGGEINTSSMASRIAHKRLQRSSPQNSADRGLMVPA